MYIYVYTHVYYSQGDQPLDPPQLQGAAAKSAAVKKWDRPGGGKVEETRHVQRLTFYWYSTDPQDGTPKIAKLPYKWLNYGVW
jgi:hypothetical protein